MWTLAFSAVVLAVLAGLACKFILDGRQIRSYTNQPHEIAWKEFAVVTLVMIFLFTPATLAVGKKLSVANIVTYGQFLNGVETKAVDNVTTCRAGHAGQSESAGRSNCHYSYDTGKDYHWTTQEPENYSCTGADGKSTTCIRMVTVHHSASIYAPYATREHHYAIESSFGFKMNETFHFPDTYLDTDPEPYGRKSIPSNYPRGAPADWQDAKERLAAGDPRSITALDKYDNYVLASDDVTLKAYSDDIDRYKEANLLPDHTAKILSDPIGGPSQSQARKLSFVDVTVPNEADWQASLMRFNTALGMKLQGDMHVVFVDAAKVPSVEAVPYTSALKAYWQSPVFGKRALAKNGIVLVAGISNNSNIEWAESTTGMPFGNELMEQYIRDNLPGSTFTPEGLFGAPKTVITGEDAEVTLSSPRGTVEQIVFESAPFARASMGCEGDDDSCVGYKDLLDTIEPTRGQKVVMLVITTFIAFILWGVVGMTSVVSDTIGGLFETWRSTPSRRTTTPYEPYRTSGNGKTKKKDRYPNEYS
jgi:hypothetical protein